MKIAGFALTDAKLSKLSSDKTTLIDNVICEFCGMFLTGFWNRNLSLHFYNILGLLLLFILFYFVIIYLPYTCFNKVYILKCQVN